MQLLVAQTLLNYKGISHAAGWQFEAEDDDAKAFLDSGQAKPVSESANSAPADKPAA